MPKKSQNSPLLTLTLEGVENNQETRRLFETMCLHALGPSGSNVNWQVDFRNPEDAKKVIIKGPPFYANSLANEVKKTPLLSELVTVNPPTE